MGWRSVRVPDTKLPWPLPGDSGLPPSRYTEGANHKGHISFNVWSLYWGFIMSARLIRSLVIELSPTLHLQSHGWSIDIPLTGCTRTLPRGYTKCQDPS